MIRVLNPKPRRLTTQQKVMVTVVLLFLLMFAAVSIALYRMAPPLGGREGPGLMGQDLYKITAVVALCCAATLFSILLCLRLIVVKPLNRLVNEVDGIDPETVRPLARAGENNRELGILADAFNDLISRIKADRDVIDQNSEKLRYAANHDALTGLLNRAGCFDALNRAIASARRDLTLVGVFFVDLDRFKFVNDSLGHSAGDLLIAAVADRLREGLTDRSVAGRIDGDSFVVVAEGFHEKNQVYLYADRVMSLFVKPFNLMNRQLYITASVGLSVYPIDAGDAETLFKYAELAMYRAKELGRNMSCRYEPELGKVLKRKLLIENCISNVINEGCRPFELYFQPKASSQTGTIHSCEALIRWITPEGIISPGEFIPLAEESGLIVPISQWVLKEAFRCAKRMEALGVEHRISVNISAQVLLRKDFLEMVRSAAAESGADTRMLDIEITEATLVGDIRHINAVLSGLHEMGVTISIDDFGTGYSSLSYLKKLLVDRIKIDRSFIVGLNSNEEDRSIVNAIMAMAKSLRLIVTAEGVEDAAQYEYLRSLACEEIQGYYISRPVPFDEYVRFAKQNGRIDRNDPIP